MTNLPCIDQPPDPIEEETPDVYPSCAVIRALEKKAKQDDENTDLPDTFLDKCFKDTIWIV